MKGQFLVGSSKAFVEGNIYADKSSLILDWILKVGVDKEGFSLREIAKDRGVSAGLVQRVVTVLVFNGLLRTEGVRTAKRFFLKNSFLLRIVSSYFLLFSSSKLLGVYLSAPRKVMR